MQEVESNAEAFLLAWFADDLQAAEAFVTEEDLAYFSLWWKASRAASATRPGRPLDGKATEIDVRPESSGRCEVRLSFTVNGREQQAFHVWVRNAGQWKIDLTSARTHVD